MNSQVVYKEDTKDGTIIIRRAVYEDIDAIIYICRICFPDQLIWCTKKQGRKTWEHFINSEFQENWVCQFNSEVVAIIRLEKDINKFKKEIQELKPDFFTALCYLIARPIILYGKILRKINKLFTTNIVCNKEMNELAKNSIWCYSSAVLPKMRNRGIGSKMMSICEKRAIELGYDSIKFFIKTSNKGSISLHERLGFTRVAKIKGGLYIFTKLLSTTENTNKEISI